MNKIKKSTIGLICGISLLTAISIPIAISTTSCSNNSKASPKEWFQFSQSDSTVVTGLNKELIGNASELIFPDFVTDIQPGIFGFPPMGSDDDSFNQIYPNIKKIDLSLTKIKVLKDMMIDEEVGEGGAGVFSFLSGLEEVVLPKNIISIGTDAFILCTKLKTINFPSSLEKIGAWAFAGCANLKQVDLSNVKTIGFSAFENSGLTSLVLSGDINYESSEEDDNDVSTFSECENLKELIILDNVINIKNNMFGGTGLEKLIIPHSVETIGEYSLWTNSPIKQVVVQQDSKLKSVTSSSFNFNKNSSNIIFYVPNENIKKVFTDAQYPEKNIKVYNDINEIPKIN